MLPDAPPSQAQGSFLWTVREGEGGNAAWRSDATLEAQLRLCHVVAIEAHLRGAPKIRIG